MSIYTDEKGRRLTEIAKDYSDGRTKQQFKSQCDINKILKRAEKAGGLAHVQKYPEAVYGEFDGEMDLLTARERIAKANDIFMDLPAEVRNEFDNDALKFTAFANDPANAGKLAQIIPAIAEPGSYFPNPVQRGGLGAGAATAPQESVEAPIASSNPPAGTEGTAESSAAEGAGQ